MESFLVTRPAVGMADRFVEEFIKMKPLLPTYCHLLLSAIFPIYTAAHASLRRPPSAARSKKSGNGNSKQQESEEESSSPIEALTTSDAILFPLLAGATLSLLYVIIKWLEDPAILNKLLGYYFSWIGTFFTYKFIKDALSLLRSFAFPRQYSVQGRLYKARPDSDTYSLFSTDDAVMIDCDGPAISQSQIKNGLGLITYCSKLYWKSRRILFTRVKCVAKLQKPLTPGSTEVCVDLINVAAAVSAFVLALLGIRLRKVPWYLTNLSGFAFCYGSLQFMTPGTSATGSLLLSLLFLYDIYMVFYTPMMVTVATKLDVPIKLLFPRPDDGTCPKPIGISPESQEMAEYQKCLAKKRTMAMLGLGDIVVPGIMIAYALRFDLYNHYRMIGKTKGSSRKDNKPDANAALNNDKPIYSSARGMWAERFYTSRRLWSNTLVAKSFPKPYFNATLCGYIVGLVMTVVIMQVYKHAQPALLYLVPGVLSTFWGVAIWRGELQILWQYDEAQEEKDTEQKRKDEDAKKGEKSGSKDNKEPKSEKIDRVDSSSSGSVNHPVLSLSFFLSPFSHEDVQSQSLQTPPVGLQNKDTTSTPRCDNALAGSTSTTSSSPSTYCSSSAESNSKENTANEELE